MWLLLHQGHHRRIVAGSVEVHVILVVAVLQKILSAATAIEPDTGRRFAEAIRKEQQRQSFQWLLRMSQGSAPMYQAV